jgi:hypothetical protein
LVDILFYLWFMNPGNVYFKNKLGHIPIIRTIIDIRTIGSMDKLFAKSTITGANNTPIMHKA